jgi:hypothetical protein
MSITLYGRVGRKPRLSTSPAIPDDHDNVEILSLTDLRRRDLRYTREEKGEEKNKGPLLLTKQSHFYVVRQ